MDIKKQINYWVETASDDLSTAQYLYDGGRLIHCLFFCHLSIEKILKAHVTKSTKDIPEKTHNLNRLLLKTDLSVSEVQKELMALLMIYQLEGRYPEYYPQQPTVESCYNYLKQTQQFFEWLKMKL